MELFYFLQMTSCPLPAASGKRGVKLFYLVNNKQFLCFYTLCLVWERLSNRDLNDDNDFMGK